MRKYFLFYIISKECDYSCYRCTISKTNCVDCKPNSKRTLQADNTCKCDLGFFDDGANADCTGKLIDNLY